MRIQIEEIWPVVDHAKYTKNIQKEKLRIKDVAADLTKLFESRSEP